MTEHVHDAPPSNKPFGLLRTIGSLILKGVLGLALAFLGMGLTIEMSSAAAVSVAIIGLAGACFLLARKFGSVNVRGAVTAFVIGNGFGTLITTTATNAPAETVQASEQTASEETATTQDVAAEPPEPVGEKARAMRTDLALRGARAVCISETQDNYPGVDWKYFRNITTKQMTDHVEVTLEGQRERQGYRVVCKSFDGDSPTTHTLYRVDAKSKKTTVEKRTLEPCLSGLWTAKSVCRPEGPKFAPRVAPGKRIDEAQSQCRRIALFEYPVIEWRWIMGIASDWIEFRGAHGVRTSIQGTRGNQNVTISCFFPDGASESLHEISAL